MKRGPAQRMTRTVDIAPVLHDLAVQLARTRLVAEPFLDLRVEKIHPDHAKCIVTCDEMRALEQLRRALLSAGHLEPRERLVAECAPSSVSTSPSSAGFGAVSMSGASAPPAIAASSIRDAAAAARRTCSAASAASSAACQRSAAPSS